MDLLIKKTSVLIFVLSLNFALLAQKVVEEEQLPFFVKKTFSDLNPDTEVQKWILKDDGNYEAHLDSKGVKGVVMLTGGGAWIATQWKMSVKDIPKDMKKHIEENYKKYKIKDFVLELRVKPNYLVFIENKKAKQKKILMFTTNKEFVKEIDSVS